LGSTAQNVLAMPRRSYSLRRAIFHFVDVLISQVGDAHFFPATALEVVMQ
jgi:hypothetical protein